MMSDTFGISPFQGRTDFDNRSSGLHPTLSDVSLSAIKTDRCNKTSVKRANLIASGANPTSLPVMLSVKSGKNVGVAEVRDLFGVVQSEGAACGIYISRHEPTKPMIEFAKQQGQFKPENFPPFDRLQIVTVQEILDSGPMNLPLMEEVAKKAQKAKVDKSERFYFQNKRAL